jgi:hypothetical protein
MATPAVRKGKVNRKVHRSAEGIAATELTRAAASTDADSECKDEMFAHDAVSRLAYSYWDARGCEGGSADEDWYRAEAELEVRAGNGLE